MFLETVFANRSRWEPTSRRLPAIAMRSTARRTQTAASLNANTGTSGRRGESLQRRAVQKDRFRSADEPLLPVTASYKPPRSRNARTGNGLHLQEWLPWRAAYEHGRLRRTSTHRIVRIRLWSLWKDCVTGSSTWRAAVSMYQSIPAAGLGSADVLQRRAGRHTVDVDGDAANTPFDPAMVWPKWTQGGRDLGNCCQWP